VAADHEDALGGAAQREPLVAGGVDLLARIRACEGAAEEASRLLPDRGPGNPLCAFRIARQLAKLLQIVDRPTGLQGRGGADTTARKL